MPASSVAFYTVCNSGYFPGLIALINSLAITGNDHPIVVGDCGMTDEQRAILLRDRRCRLFPLDPELVQNPMQYKPFAHLTGADGVVVMIDSDMIVTGSLEPIIARARDGQLCAFANPFDRWFPEWQGIFGLSAPPRRQTYICTGFVAFSTHHWPALLEQWWEACTRIASHLTFQEGISWNLPTAQGDQDALNAVLMSEYAADRLTVEPEHGQVSRWDFSPVKVLDARRLKCSLSGRQPVILHASLTPKPWQRGGAKRDAYFIFLRRLLLEPDVCLMPPATLLDEVTGAGWRPWITRQICFLRNMGAARLLLSYCPAEVRLLARRAQTLAMGLLSALRGQRAANKVAL